MKMSYAPPLTMYTITAMIIYDKEGKKKRLTDE